MSVKNLKKVKPFNWFIALENAISGNFEGTAFDAEGHHIFPKIYPDGPDALVRRASNWPTCACGQLCKHIPRGVNSSPLDFKLEYLGREFYQYIEAKNYKRALNIMHDIEARVREILS